MKIGILIFDEITQLDAMGPWEVFARIPGAKVLLVAKKKRPVAAQFGLTLVPHTDIRRCPKLDVLCVPGGSGVNELLLDDTVLAFVRRQARRARYVTSVCTGSLVLGAAGLLRGRRAACHWLSLPLLAAFGAKPSSRRIERDGKFITAGGVTSGIDFGLQLAALVAGKAEARKIQLMIQYDPQPPFRFGTPRQAGKAVTAAIIRKQRTFQARRAVLVARAAARLSR
jgi:cyclohexyl-isocyanide hydratase